MAQRGGIVTLVAPDQIMVGGIRHEVLPFSSGGPERYGELIWPSSDFGQEPIVKVGQEVQRKQLLARGTTHIYFQANMWIFTVLVFAVGILMGIGKAAVYKHIPDYYPNDVGTVGGIVGVIGGLGGFACPIIFGYMLEATGLWTTTWMLFTVLSILCLVWMHRTIHKMQLHHAPEIVRRIEEPEFLEQ